MLQIDRISLTKKKLSKRGLRYIPSKEIKISKNKEQLSVLNFGTIEQLSYLMDVVSKKKYLIDSRAVTSLIPCQKDDKKHIDNETVFTVANDQHVKTYGTKFVALQFDQGIVVPWIFTVADLYKNIIGMDVIKQNNLLVHPRKNPAVLYDMNVRVKTNTCPKARMSPIQAINADVQREIE